MNEKIFLCPHIAKSAERAQYRRFVFAIKLLALFSLPLCEISCLIKKLTFKGCISFVMHFFSLNSSILWTWCEKTALNFRLHFLIRLIAFRSFRAKLPSDLVYLPLSTKNAFSMAAMTFVLNSSWPHQNLGFKIFRLSWILKMHVFDINE